MILKIIGIFVLLVILFFVYEIHRAPMMPDDYDEDLTDVIKDEEDQTETDHTIQ